MRILATSSSGRGHLGPLLPVLGAAADAGHDVRVAVSGSGTPLVAASERRALSDGRMRSAAGALARELAALPPVESTTPVLEAVAASYGRPARLSEPLAMLGAGRPTPGTTPGSPPRSRR